MTVIPCFIKTNKMKNLIIVLSVFLTVITSVSAQTDTKKEEQKTIFNCPMHPNEASFKKGECSKCGMKMVKTTTRKHNSAVKGSKRAVKLKQNMFVQWTAQHLTNLAIVLNAEWK